MAADYYGRSSAGQSPASWAPDPVFVTGRRPPKRSALPSSIPSPPKRQRTAGNARPKRAQPEGRLSGQKEPEGSREKAQPRGNPPREEQRHTELPAREQSPAEELPPGNEQTRRKRPEAAQAPGTPPTQAEAAAPHYEAVQTALEQLRRLVASMVDELPLDGIGYLRTTLVGSLDDISSTFEDKVSRKWGKKGIEPPFRLSSRSTIDRPLTKPAYTGSSPHLHAPSYTNPSVFAHTGQGPARADNLLDLVVGPTPKDATQLPKGPRDNLAPPGGTLPAPVPGDETQAEETQAEETQAEETQAEETEAEESQVEETEAEESQAEESQGEESETEETQATKNQAKKKKKKAEKAQAKKKQAEDKPAAKASIAAVLEEVENDLRPAGHALAAALRRGVPGDEALENETTSTLALAEEDVCLLVRTLLLDTFGAAARRRIQAAITQFFAPQSQALRAALAARGTADVLRSDGQEGLADLVQHWAGTVQDGDQGRSAPARLALLAQRVQLVEMWDRVAEPTAAERASLERYLGAHGFCTGRLASRLAGFLSGQLGLRKKQITDLVYRFRPAAVLVAHFGPGILVFAPPNLATLLRAFLAHSGRGQRRHRDRCLRFAAESLLQAAPALRDLCATANQTIVQPFLEGRAPGVTRLASLAQSGRAKEMPDLSVLDMVTAVVPAS